MTALENQTDAAGGQRSLYEMNTGKRVVRNSLLGVISQALGGGLFFFVAILVARHLGPGDFGTWSFIFAFVFVFQMLADFGLTNILVREIARRREEVATILGAVIPLVTLIALLGSGFIVGAVQLMPLGPTAQTATYILGGTVLLTFHAAVFGNVSRAFEDMGLNAVGVVLQRILLLVLVLIALRLDAGLPGIALCYLGERAFQWAFFRFMVRVRYARYRWRIDTSYWFYLLKEGLPVGIGMVLRRISWHIHTFMLTILSTAVAVGLFSSAYRVVQMISVIPFTLAMPMFPVLSRLASVSVERTFSAYLRALKIFMLLGVPIGVWLAVTGAPLIELLFGAAYAEAGNALRMMGIVVVFLFLNGMLVYLFTALGQQRYYMVSVGISVALNLVLDLLLIPVMGILGAALAALVAEAGLFFSATWFLVRQGLVIQYGRLLGRPLIAALPAAAPLLWPLDSPSWLPLVAASLAFGVLYLGLACLLGALESDEIRHLREGLRP